MIKVKIVSVNVFVENYLDLKMIIISLVSSVRRGVDSNTSLGQYGLKCSLHIFEIYNDTIYCVTSSNKNCIKHEQ